MSDLPKSSKQSRKSKAKQLPASLVKIFVDDWVDIADKLCVSLDLPNLTSRSGLKKIHSDLPAIEGRLNQAFKYAKRYGNVKVLGGVLSIFTKMCMVDTILQDKLIESGFLDRTMSLIEFPETRHLALRTMNAISTHTGKRYRNNILKHIATLTKLLKQHPHDAIVSSMVTSIFSHSVLHSDAKSYFDMPAMAKAVLDSLRNPIFSDFMFGHAVGLLRQTVLEFPEKCRVIPSMTTFFVALLRSADFRQRATALHCLFELSLSQDEDRKGTSPFGMVNHLKTRPLPPDLARILSKRGAEFSEILMTKASNEKYLALYMQHTLSPDLVKLGRGLATEILSSQYSTPEILCKCCARPTRYNTDFTGHELLIKCASALRSCAELTSADLDLADVLEWKYLAAKDFEQALKHARDAMGRNSECGFFHYAVAVDADADASERLRVAKKGLKCQDMPPWTRAELLRLAVDSALCLALSGASIKDRDERVGLLVGAYADAKKLIEISNLDSMNRQRDLSVYIVMTLIIRGPNIDLTSPELKRALTEIELNGKFMSCLYSPLNTFPYINRTRQTIVSGMSEALKEWGPTLDHIQTILTPHELPAPSCDEDAGLTSWLQKFEDQLSEVHDGVSVEKSNGPAWSPFSDERVALLQCAWCRRPSAVIKKCARCGTVQYCDSECQKRHWKEHKNVCGTEISNVTAA